MPQNAQNLKKKKKCVSIDAKCSETHRNEKKNMPYEWHFPLPQNAQNFQKQKKCVSIDSNCSETQINAKRNFTPYEWYFPLPQNTQILTQSIGPKFQNFHQV